MKEPYEKGVAIHSAPSFAVTAVKSPRKRKQGYRRVGYRASKSSFGAPTLSFEAEGNMARSENASPWSALRSLQTPSTPGNSMHENREPVGEGSSRTSRMHVFEESDSGIIPMSRLNKDGDDPLRRARREGR